jgi:hypothetical protein
MELIIALVLFFGLLASWLVLPGTSTSTAVANMEGEATGLGRSTVGHSA